MYVQVISHASTYEEALSKLYRALDEFLVRGVKTNIGFVGNVIKHPEFAAGKATTSFIERNADALFKVNDEGLMGQKLMNYLSEMVVNGPNHPGAIGAPSSRNIPVIPEFPQLDGANLTGWKDVLTKEGPEGWAKAVRSHKGLLVTDTTMRDAHQSLLATRMRTYDLLRAAEPTAKVRRAIVYRPVCCSSAWMLCRAAQSRQLCLWHSDMIFSLLLYFRSTTVSTTLFTRWSNWALQPPREPQGSSELFPWYDLTSKNTRQRFVAVYPHSMRPQRSGAGPSQNSAILRFLRFHGMCTCMQVLAPAGSLEMWGGATFDVAMRFLHECPWERLESLREKIPNIPFQMLLRGANAVGYTSYPDNVVRAFTAQAAKSGVDIFRVFDSLNYLDNLKFCMDAVHQAGGIVEGTICYSGALTHHCIATLATPNIVFVTLFHEDYGKQPSDGIDIQSDIVS